MRRLLVLTAALLLAAPAGAEAARRHVVSGAGYGHGVGMSQWGAHGFAKKGRTYQEILAHYYRGTQLARVPNTTVRVLLQDRVPEVTFAGAEAAGGRRLDPSRTYRVRAAGAGVEVRSGARARRAHSGAARGRRLRRHASGSAAGRSTASAPASTAAGWSSDPARAG